MLRPLTKILPLALTFVATFALASAAAAQDDKGGKPKPKPEQKKEEKNSATKDDYKIVTSASSTEIKLSGDGKLSILIQPGEGLKVHPQAPLEARLKASNGIKPAKKKLGRKDVTEAESHAPEMTCDLHAEAAGEHKVDAEISFFLCSESWCQRMKDTVSITVKVPPPAS